jgi:hypothetical protein
MPRTVKGEVIAFNPGNGACAIEIIHRKEDCPPNPDCPGCCQINFVYRGSQPPSVLPVLLEYTPTEGCSVVE